MATIRVEFKVSREISDFLTAKAGERGISRSDLVEELLRQYVDQANARGAASAPLAKEWHPRVMQDSEFEFCLEDFAEHFNFSIEDLLIQLEEGEDYIKWDHATHYGSYAAVETAVAVLRMACNDKDADKLGSWIEKHMG